MTYVFDIDGTICTLVDGDYKKAEPIAGRVEKINALHDEGHIIIFQTARGMGRYKQDLEKAVETFYDMTEEQLNSWGVRYHGLFLGKPAGDIYVDDKGVKDEDFFSN